MGFAPKDCEESRKILLRKLKELAKELDNGCCDECCPDSPVKRKTRKDHANPCLGHFPSRRVPVPPGINPNSRRHSVYQTKLTLDGKLIPESTKNEDGDEEFDRYPSPPWFQPRSKSQELRAGFFHLGCDCYKRNGLQGNCQRTECGLSDCLHRPPECEPSTFSPHTGVRIPNMRSNQYHNYNHY